MPISKGDIKLNQSQRMTDNDDGGGRITGIEVIDGESNGIFDDVSDLDRTTGNVALRKVYPGVSTPDNDVYMGGNVIIAEAPTDPNVNICIFTTGDFDDQRTSARDQIERYQVQAGRAQWELIGNHYQNQRQLVGVQREEVELPQTGDVFVLTNLSLETQFVRVTDVDSEVRTYSYLSGQSYIEFTRRRIVLGISSPLLYDQEGGEVYPNGTLGDTGDVYTTEVADAARYWGISPTISEAGLGDIEVYVDDIYTNLVPSAQTETPIVDMPLGYDQGAIKAAATTGEVFTADVKAVYTSASAIELFLVRPCTPGTLLLNMGGSDYTEENTGQLLRASGNNPFNTLTIDYKLGKISGTRDSGTAVVGSTISAEVSFTPGINFIGRGDSSTIDVTINNRGYNWIRTFATGKPLPGTMVISYMVLGKWYTVKDSGSGVLTGYGIGTIDFATGTVSVTLEALPDVGSSIIYNFVMDLLTEFNTHSGLNETSQAAFEFGTTALERRTLDITYTAGGEAAHIYDDGDGNLTGAGTGSVDYGSGRVKAKPTLVQDDGTGFSVDYNRGDSKFGKVQSRDPSTDLYQGILPNPPVAPGSVSIRVKVSRPVGKGGYNRVDRIIRDDGEGGWLDSFHTPHAGTIDYAEGTFTIVPIDREVPVTWTEMEYFIDTNSNGTTFWNTRGHTTKTAIRQERAGPYFGTISWYWSVRFREQSEVTVPSTAAESPTQMTLEIVENIDDPLLPNSVLFKFGEMEYFDRDGLIYTNHNSENNAGSLVGSINYETRTAILDTWIGGTPSGVMVYGAATAGDKILTNAIQFRTPAAPIRPQSFIIVVTAEDGTIINATSDVNGDIKAEGVDGTINYETGVVKIHFTTAADPITGMTSEVFVFPDGKYSAVLYSFLPLDASLIGLDPVRLPSDGRVPIYRAGDVAVLHNSISTVMPLALTADQVVDIGRERIAAIRIEDATGQIVPTTQYTPDLDSGTLTMANPLDKTEHPEPWSAIHRIEDMSLIGDVDISGRITLTSPLSHEYPLPSFLSTALVIGDLGSRVSNLLDQSTWTGVWSDALIGDEPTAEYNDALYPITTTNAGSLQQRWALIFTGQTSFRIVGETIGEIGYGSTGTTTQPTNPNSSVPYFVVEAGGWGLGWSAGNVLRFNTIGANYPIWIARTVMQSQPAGDSDTFRLQIRGNVNADA